MAGIYEFTVWEQLSEELEPSRIAVYSRDQAVVRTPLGLQMSMDFWVPPGEEAVGIMGVPPTRGMTEVFHLNCRGGYRAGVPIKPEEVPLRVPRFMEFCVPLMKDPWKVWNDYKAEMDEAWKPVVDFVTTKLEKAEDHEISMFLDDVFWPASRKAHRIHMFMMYPLGGMYMQLEEFCTSLLGISDKDASFRKMFQGFDNLAFQVDKKLWQLGRRAEELGLKPTFEKAKGSGAPQLA